MPRRPKYTDEQLARAVAGASNLHQLLKSLNVSPGGGNYESVRKRMATTGLDGSRLQRRTPSWGSETELRDSVMRSRSYSQVMVALGLPSGGRLQEALRRHIKALGCDVSHFTGRSWRRGTALPVRPATELALVLVDGRLFRTGHLKRRLIAEGLKQARCECCGGTQWNGQAIPLELDHINGRRNDNRLDNLRLLCPNCHAQTSTYRGRNIRARGNL